MPSNLLFEERYPPSDPKRRRRERLTAGDRLVCALMGGFLGLVIWAFAYGIALLFVLKALARQAGAGALIDPFDKILSFSWGALVMASFAIYSASVGAERMMDTFGVIVHILGKIARSLDRD